MTVQLFEGDCRVVLRELADGSVDSVVTDPPYELGFMGKKWDASGIAYDVELWSECLRVLKPGGHLLAFGGTRTYHRMAVAIEDAGFEIRDSIHWLYGSGFPKSLNVSKAIDKAAGALKHEGRMFTVAGRTDANLPNPPVKGYTPPAPVTDVARQWEGWGTALKPAHEPIVVARKPLTGTVAATVLEHCTGALNIEGCRVAATDKYEKAWDRLVSTNIGACGKDNYITDGSQHTIDISANKPSGRWPANLVFTHAADCEQVGIVDDTFGGGANATSGFVSGYESGDGFVGQSVTVPVWRCAEGCPVAELDEQSGGASRFFTVTEFDPIADVVPFRYVSKSSKRERNAGLEDMPARFAPTMNDGIGGKHHNPETATPKHNHHSTVKPLALMRWLVRLVTPPGGTVLDPFAGSGTTLVAAVLEGFDAIGIELTVDYHPIIQRRINWAEQQPQPLIKDHP